MKQISVEEWKRGDRHWREYALASLMRTAEELGRQHRLSFATEWEDGLGDIRFACCETASGRTFVLVQYLWSPASHRDRTHIVVKEFTDRPVSAPAELLDEILEELLLTSADLGWVNPDIVFTAHDVWRQDDNGHRILVRSLACRADAAAAVREFESHHHRQVYWTERSSRA